MFNTRRKVKKYKPPNQIWKGMIGHFDVGIYHHLGLRVPIHYERNVRMSGTWHTATLYPFSFVAIAWGRG